MDTATVVDLGRQALWMTVLISAPLLGVALFVGLAIGILQAATSINEATLSFIPKLAALAIGHVHDAGANYARLNPSKVSQMSDSRYLHGRF